MTMITAASVSDWAMMGTLVVSLGGFAAIGHRWMLREAAEERVVAERETRDDSREMAA
jgi:hypothetical protein